MLKLFVTWNRVFILFIYVSTLLVLLSFQTASHAENASMSQTPETALKSRTIAGLSEKEKAWLQKKHTVRVRVAETPPYQSRNPEASGISVDYIKLAARDLGFNLDLVTDDIQWKTALSDIAGEKNYYDLILTIKRTPEREKLMCFTDEYIFVPWVIVSRKDENIQSADDLENKVIASVNGYAVNSLVQSRYSHITPLVTSKPLEALRAVATSGADAYIGDLSVIHYLIKNEGLYNLKITAGTPFGNHNQSMGIRKDWPELASMLSTFFHSMKLEDRNAIFQKWVSVSYEQKFDYATLWKIAGSAFLVIVLILIWNRHLKYEVKKQTATLKESEERLQFIFDNVPQTIFLLNEDREIVKINQTGKQLAQCPKDPLPHSTCNNILNCLTSPDGRFICEGGDKCASCVLRQTIYKTFEENKNYYKVEARIQSKGIHNRTESTYLVSTSVIKPGSPKTILVILDDITEFRTMEEHLRQSQKMEAIGTLAGGVAHDFNNILSVILGYTEISLEELDPDTDMFLNLNEIQTAGNRAKELVRQILSFSRQSEKAFQPLEVQSILKEAIKLLHSSLPSTIEIREDIDSNCQPVMADSTRIHQIVMNLCTNAYQAMRETGGILAVSLHPVNLTEDIRQLGLNLNPGDYLDLKISDTGCGIPQKMLKKIFEPYYTTKPKEQGTGLGLAIVHGIVKHFSGDIFVYSEPGQGTTFHVYLPVVEFAEYQLPNKEILPLPKGDEHILIVDDDEKIVGMQKKMLEQLGYKITAVTESITALAEFEKNPDDFDMVITDMTMPVMTGDHLTQKILSIKPDIPVMLCTGYSDLINAEKAESIGVKHYLMKPVNQKYLAGKVRSLLDSIKQQPG